MYRTDQYSEHSSITWSVWSNSRVFVSDNYWVWIQSPTEYVTWQEHTRKCTVQITTQNTARFIWSVAPNGWVFVYELTGSWFESSCSHLNFRFRPCLEQGVPWHSGNYRVWIQSQCVRDMTRIYTQMDHSDNFSEQLDHSAVSLNCWVFIYKLSGSGFESQWSHLNFRFRTCFEQRVTWHSGNFSVWIHSETHTWHDKNIQLMRRTNKYSEYSPIIWSVW